MSPTSALPPARNATQNLPALLYSWWCTVFAAMLILARLAARKISLDMLFIEDKIMAAAIVPMIVRMILVHLVLNRGTNNVNPIGLSIDAIHAREYGSKLVLGARVAFAVSLWTSQAATLEFILRNFVQGVNRVKTVVPIVRVYLIISLLASIAAVLLGCHPVSEAWMIHPTPDTVCREGTIGLAVTGGFTVITNLLSAIYPISVVATLRLPTSKKVVLSMLFSAPVALVIVTLIRIPAVIQHSGSQEYRTVWASTEILVEIFVANMLILGTYVRGSGIKKAKNSSGGSYPRSYDAVVKRQQWSSKRMRTLDKGDTIIELEEQPAALM